MAVSGFLPAIRRAWEQLLGFSSAPDAEGTGSRLQLHNVCWELSAGSPGYGLGREGGTVRAPELWTPS